MNTRAVRPYCPVSSYLYGCFPFFGRSYRAIIVAMLGPDFVQKLEFSPVPVLEVLHLGLVLGFEVASFPSFLQLKVPLGFLV